MTCGRSPRAGSPYKIPRYVGIVEEFPMTVSGKVRKVEMRRASIELLGLRDAATTRHA